MGSCYNCSGLNRTVAMQGFQFLVFILVLVTCSAFSLEGWLDGFGNSDDSPSVRYLKDKINRSAQAIMDKIGGEEEIGSHDADDDENKDEDEDDDVDEVDDDEDSDEDDDDNDSEEDDEFEEEDYDDYEYDDDDYDYEEDGSDDKD